MSVKKAFEPIVELLEAEIEKNPKVRVKELMDRIIELASPKGKTSIKAFIKNAQGDVIAIFDTYFKKWMPLVGEAAVKFTLKGNTASGFNPMSAEAQSLYTKAERKAKNAGRALLERLTLPADNENYLSQEMLAAEMEKIEQERTAVPPTYLGFDSKEELVSYLNAQGQDIPEAELVTDEDHYLK